MNGVSSGTVSWPKLSHNPLLVNYKSSRGSSGQSLPSDNSNVTICLHWRHLVVVSYICWACKKNGQTDRQSCCVAFRGIIIKTLFWKNYLREMIFLQQSIYQFQTIHVIGSWCNVSFLHLTCQLTGIKGAIKVFIKSCQKKQIHSTTLAIAWTDSKLIIRLIW